MFKRIGKSPSGERLEGIQKTINFKNGKFQNVEPTSINPNNVSFFTILKEMIQRPKTVSPSQELPHTKTNLLKLPDERPTIVWFGHSSYFLTYSGFKILVDPVFSGNASPVKFFGKSFPGTDIFSAEDFPEIDLLVITHDHYDHMDYHFIKQLNPKVKKFITPLGVGEHLEHWGIGSKRIIELNWGEHWQENNLKISAFPSRHFSGRGLSRFNTLWASFVLEWGEYRIYIGSDSGYSSEFKRIGEEFGEFDVAFLECGQYNSYWPQIHMTPEETVQAAKDLKTKVLFPVHWAKFVLSSHPWNEPINRVFREAERMGQNCISPIIGEAYTIGEPYIQKKWWNFEEN